MATSQSQFATPVTGTPTLSPTKHLSGTNGTSTTLNGVKKQGPVVCVFCGAKDGSSPVHLAAARDLADAFHKNNINLVYGGGTVGIMGELAKTLVSLSGPESVHGIIPAALMRYEQGWDASDPDNAGKAIDEKIFGRTTVVPDMHTRKQMMAKEVISGGPGGGFVALSGGYGTMEELMEVTTWNQLGIHDKGVVVFNVEGYWDGLISWVKTAVNQGFIASNNANILVEALTANDVVSFLKNYKNAEGRFDLDWTKEG
ncbi:lysine decarboxylase-like protein-like protein [Rhizodiscina lignyota]|uniref:Lysine decarboxylase-like protein-like protein n=1 Tax=Rhizodiscina lignyota TaxID=1504668 RepID=A0A9P4IC58_9PEZI|nr:lysine decarboxylase-like protein-like protein [Rhizodiscina lignyota]